MHWAVTGLSVRRHRWIPGPGDTARSPRKCGALPEPEAPALEVTLPRHRRQETGLLGVCSSGGEKDPGPEHKRWDKSQKGEEGQAQRPGWAHASRLGRQASLGGPRRTIGPSSPASQIPSSKTCLQSSHQHPAHCPPSPAAPPVPQQPHLPGACPHRRTTPPRWQQHRKEG